MEKNDFQDETARIIFYFQQLFLIDLLHNDQNDNNNCILRRLNFRALSWYDVYLMLFELLFYIIENCN